MYQVSRGYMARGFGAAIVAGVVGGIVLAFAVPFLGDFYGGIAVAGVGYLVGEAISRATNYKRGTPLVVASVVGMVVALVAFLAVLGGTPTLFELLGLGAGTYYAVTRVR
jgi:hypothetical protein